jgi:hypothetical protein
MIDLDAPALLAALTVCDPLVIRTIAFDTPTFDLLKDMQRRLVGKLRRQIGNAEVVKYLLHTHPETANAVERHGR